ncbi:hypothetical protein MBLNU230_g3126t1 [Neophaeotheca triangularis]
MSGSSKPSPQVVRRSSQVFANQDHLPIRESPRSDSRTPRRGQSGDNVKELLRSANIQDNIDGVANTLTESPIQARKNAARPMFRSTSRAGPETPSPMSNLATHTQLPPSEDARRARSRQPSSDVAGIGPGLSTNISSSQPGAQSSNSTSPVESNPQSSAGSYRTASECCGTIPPPAFLQTTGSESLQNTELHFYKVTSAHMMPGQDNGGQSTSKKLSRFIHRHGLKYLFENAEKLSHVHSDYFLSPVKLAHKQRPIRMRKVPANVSRNVSTTGGQAPQARVGDDKWSLIVVDASSPAVSTCDLSVNVEEIEKDSLFELARVRSFFPKDDLKETEHHEQQSRSNLDAVIASLLRLQFEKAEIVDVAKTFSHGNRVFSHMHSELIPNLALKKHGLEGRIVYDDCGLSPSLAWKPCVANFIPEALVSDFLIAVAGPCMSEAKYLTDARMNRLTKMLKGKRVAVALASGCEKQTYSIIGFCQSAQDDPSALYLTNKRVTLSSMRYPDMACLRAVRTGPGFSKQPVTLPAELCKILPGQSLRFEPPLQASDISVPRPGRAVTEYVPKDGDPFEGIRPDTFTLLFARVVDENSPVSSDDELSAKSWDNFKTEIGKRFNGKLREAVDRFNDEMYRNDDSEEVDDTVIKRKVNDQKGSWADMWQNHFEDLWHSIEQRSGKDTVLIVAIPPSLAKTEVNQMKAFCDVKLGIQACFVNTRELSKRYEPRARRDQSPMVKYTGAVVRLFFSRALAPAIDGDATSSATNDPPEDYGKLVVGLQVTRMKSFFAGRGTDSKPTVSGDDGERFLVTIVAFDGTERRLTSTFKMPVGNLTDLPRLLAEKINETVDLSSYKQTVIHFVGHDAFDLGFFDPFLNLLDRLRLQHPLATNTSEQVQIVAYSAESKLSSMGASETPHSTIPLECISQVDNPSDALPAPVHGAAKNSVFGDRELRSHITNVTNLDSALRAVFVHPGGNSQSLKQDPYRVSYHHSMTAQNATQKFRYTFAPNQQAHIHYRQLERRALPPIVFLVQKATKRALTRMDTSTDGTQPLEVPETHVALQHSLYFL